MDWLFHPRYIRFCDELADRFREKSYLFPNVRPLIFLCGGKDSSHRNALAEYLRHHHREKLLFYADHVWDHIANQTNLNALEMEERLADLADLVLIIVESAGTLAELGAFSLSEKLRRKLLPIVDEQYKLDLSFVNTGPLRWIDQYSQFKPPIFVNFSHFLESTIQVENRLNKLSRESTEVVADLAASPRHMLYLLCDLVAVIGPAPPRHFEYLLCRITGTAVPGELVLSLLGLGLAMEIIKFTAQADMHTNLYFRNPIEGRIEAFTHREMFDLERQRARFLSILQQIDPDGKTLETLKVRHAD